jgi:GAF domain-containing protein
MELLSPDRSEDPLSGVPATSWSALERLARALHLRNAELGPTLEATVASALETVEGADAAGLITLRRGVLSTLTTSGPEPRVLDALQHELGSGPCVEAARNQRVVRIADMASDGRWAPFRARAAELGVAAMLCLPLWVDEECLGTLSFYAREPAVFSDQHVRIGGLFACHAAIALAEAQRTAQLQQALRSRDVIGQAKGILMERHKITSDDAFRTLSLASQRRNEKLVAVAELLVESGTL